MNAESFGLPTGDDVDVEALRTELGIPADARVVVYLMDPLPAGWDGYTVEQIGCLMPQPRWPPEWPWDWREEDEPGLFVQLWSQRVCRNGTAPYIEVRWHPERGISRSIRGLEHPFTVSDATDLLKRVTRLRELAPDVGRPEGRTITEKEMRDYRASFKGEHDRAPKNTEAAEHFKVSAKTVRRVLDDAIAAGRTWD